MKLYEIDQAILDCIDMETGEVDEERITALQIERDNKIEQLLLWKKDLDAEAQAIANEIKTLTERKQEAERKAESLKRFVKFALNGEKFSTPRVAVSYRKVSSVALTDELGTLDWALANADDLVKFGDPTLSKTAIKKAIEDGRTIPGAFIETKNQIIIK